MSGPHIPPYLVMTLRSRVEPEADGVQGAQPRAAPATVRVGLGDPAAGQPDPRPAQSLRRDRHRLAAAHLHRGPLVVGAPEQAEQPLPAEPGRADAEPGVA